MDINMTSDTWLAVFILCLLTYTAYCIITNKTTPEERDEMLNDKEMWP